MKKKLFIFIPSLGEVKTQKLTETTVIGVINKYGELVSYPPLDIRYTKVELKRRN